VEHQLWVDAREADRAYREASSATLDAWLAKEWAEEAYDNADAALTLAQCVEAEMRGRYIEARRIAEEAYAGSCAHDRALGA
jgi:hypothetical protein